MVHALEEIHRVLKPTGMLIDLRPIADRWPVEVVASGEILAAGRVSDLKQGLEDDEAANQAMDTAARAGWFLCEREEHFALNIYWDTPTEMQQYIEEEWTEFVQIDDATWKNVRAIWATANADARPRIRLKMLITKWRKAI
jgi:hypothetical protein